MRAEYDYIIIGGGTAGCPLAATLSQAFSVLVLERGGAPYDHPAVQNSVNFASVLTDVDDDAISAAQAFQSEDHLLFRRARILGGGSAINAGFYSRAETTWITDRALDIARVNSSYEWVEKVVAQVPQLGPWQIAFQNALLEVGIRPFHNFTIDHVHGTKTGGTTFDAVGHRYTAADLLQYANPHNIQVLIYATAHRITFSFDKTSGNAMSSLQNLLIDQRKLKRCSPIFKSVKILKFCSSIFLESLPNHVLLVLSQYFDPVTISS